jgi:hypothetical protein
VYACVHRAVAYAFVTNKLFVFVGAYEEDGESLDMRKMEEVEFYESDL